MNGGRDFPTGSGRGVLYYACRTIRTPQRGLMTTSFPPPRPTYAATSGAAKKALVFGIVSLLCCGCFAGIPAIFFGVSALNEIEVARGGLTGKGMAWAGIVLGIVGTLASGTAAAVYQQSH